MIRVTVDNGKKSYTIEMHEWTDEGWMVGIEGEPQDEYVQCGSTSSALSFMRALVKQTLEESK